MSKSRKILELLMDKELGKRETGRACKVSHSTVIEYAERASEAGLDWEEIQTLNATQLEARLFPSKPGELRPMPDWPRVHEEMGEKGVTLQLLWEEYKERFPEGYQYSRFCELYGEYRKSLDVSLRQQHRAGEKLFVDYSGQTVAIHDPRGGAVRSAEIFVAVLGASDYTYAEATWTQGLEDWIDSHVRTFEYLEGVSEIVVPDNLRSGVTRACRYEPELNRTYEEMAAHYGTVIVPARVRKPKDKAKAEAGVLLVQRWILASLRHRRFFSLEELNSAIAELLERLNNRPFKKLEGTRRSRFLALDAPALRPLPAQRFECAEWQRQRVRKDYHVSVDAHAYSVPYALVGREVEIRLASQTVEVFHRDQRVACHLRSPETGASTTLRDHMPPQHRHYLEWTPQRLVDWSRRVGPCTAAVVEAIQQAKAHPIQGTRACLGLHRLGKRYGEARLEATCQRALEIRTLSLRSLRSILERGLDQVAPAASTQAVVIQHENIRGAGYYGAELGEEVASC